MGIREGWHFDKGFGYTGSLSTKNMKRGGQTSNDRLDESLARRTEQNAPKNNPIKIVGMRVGV